MSWARPGSILRGGAAYVVMDCSVHTRAAREGLRDSGWVSTEDLGL